MNPRVLPQVSSQSLQLSSEASEIERILLLYVHEESRTWRLGLRALSFAQTSPERLNVIHGQHVTTSSYVIHFERASNFGEPHPPE